ncbi:hypothetical protein BC834DRAFT_871219 [Gloeopeniophorella convolvens]|nr:hypothetical protein BC834DRAFT_871219 [Gloeopeniophorella convolvens]
MSSELRIDFSDPAVRDYMSLIRLQVLTPLSLLINIATLLVCSLILHPSLRGVTHLHPASISPSVPAIAAYILVIYLGQIGYCVLLVIARKVETKNTIIKGVGIALVLANVVMAGWAIAWTFGAFLTSTILLGVLTLLLLYCNVVLITYHVPTWSRPLDIAFIHAPVRLFFILPLSLLFPYSLFVTLGHAWNPAHPDHYDKHQWEGFAVLLAVNVIGLLVIATRHDLVWCIGATWVCVAIWLEDPKPVPVYITAVMFTVFHPITLVAAILWTRFAGKRAEGQIRLPPDEETVREGQVTNGHEVHATNGHEVQADWS